MYYCVIFYKVKIIKFSVHFRPSPISTRHHIPVSFLARVMKVVNCFGQFLRSEKSKLIKNAKLDFDKVLKSWKAMTEEGKSEFRKMSVADKLSLGDKCRKSTKKVPKQMEKVKGKDSWKERRKANC